MDTVHRGLSALVVLTFVAVTVYAASLVMLWGASWALAAEEPAHRFAGCLAVTAPAAAAMLGSRYLHRASARGAYLVVGTAGLTLTGAFAAALITLPLHGGL